MTKILLCPTCKGYGKNMTDITDYNVHPADRISEHKMLKCSRCKGSGRLIKEIIYKAYDEKGSSQ